MSDNDGDSQIDAMEFYRKSWSFPDVSVFEFKPTLWQRFLLMFCPVYQGVDIAAGVRVTIECKKLNGCIVITSFKRIDENVE